MCADGVCVCVSCEQECVLMVCVCAAGAAGSPALRRAAGL